MGKSHKQEVAHLLVDGLPASFAVLNLTQGELDYAKRNPETTNVVKRDRHGRETAAQTVGSQQYAAGVKRLKVSEAEEMMLLTFFVATTYQASGDKTQTRIMGKAQWEWTSELHAMYPTLLRDLARVCTLRP